MTRKHFKAIAEALAYSRPRLDTAGDFPQWEKDRKEIMDVLARFNGNFDRGRFIEATEAK